MIGREDPEKLWKRVRRCNAKLVSYINPVDMLPYLPCLEKNQTERIRAEQRNEGPQRAYQTFIDELERRGAKGFREFVQALRHPKIAFEDKAQLIDPDGLVSENAETDSELASPNTATLPPYQTSSLPQPGPGPPLPFTPVSGLGPRGISLPSSPTYIPESSLLKKPDQAVDGQTQTEESSRDAGSNFVIHANNVQIGNQGQMAVGSQSGEETGIEEEVLYPEKERLLADLDFTLRIDESDASVQCSSDHTYTSLKAVTSERQTPHGEAEAVGYVLDSVDVTSAGPQRNNAVIKLSQPQGEGDINQASLIRQPETCSTIDHEDNSSRNTSVSYEYVPSAESLPNFPVFPEQSPVGVPYVEELRIPAIMPTVRSRASTEPSSGNVTQDVAAHSGLTLSDTSQISFNEKASDPIILNHMAETLGVHVRDPSSKDEGETELKVLSKNSTVQEEVQQRVCQLVGMENSTETLESVQSYVNILNNKTETMPSGLTTVFEENTGNLPKAAEDYDSTLSLEIPSSISDASSCKSPHRLSDQSMKAGNPHRLNDGSFTELHGVKKDDSPIMENLNEINDAKCCMSVTVGITTESPQSGPSPATVKVMPESSGNPDVEMNSNMPGISGGTKCLTKEERSVHNDIQPSEENSCVRISSNQEKNSTTFNKVAKCLVLGSVILVGCAVVIKFRQQQLNS